MSIFHFRHYMTLLCTSSSFLSPPQIAIHAYLALLPTLPRTLFQLFPSPCVSSSTEAQNQRLKTKQGTHTMQPLSLRNPNRIPTICRLRIISPIPRQYPLPLFQQFFFFPQIMRRTPTRNSRSRTSEKRGSREGGWLSRSVEHSLEFSAFGSTLKHLDYPTPRSVVLKFKA